MSMIMLMVLSWWWCESSPGSFDEYRLSDRWPPTLRPSRPTCPVSAPIGCYHSHPPLPLVSPEPDTHFAVQLTYLLKSASWQLIVCINCDHMASFLSSNVFLCVNIFHSAGTMDQHTWWSILLLSAYTCRSNVELHIRAACRPMLELLSNCVRCTAYSRRHFFSYGH